MKPLRIAVASFAALVLAGCASMDGRTGSRISPERAPGSIVTDEEYVARVEALARTRHMNVHWVNVPTRRVPRDD